MCCKICFRTKIWYKTLCETSHRATNTYYDNETCRAALGIQALQRVNNLFSLDGLDCLCQVKVAFRMETCVIKSFNPYKPGVLYLCIENRK